MRAPVLAANWKMNHGPREAESFARDFLAGWHTVPSGVEVVVIPPFVDLAAAQAAFAGRPISIGGQNCHWESIGAFTGEISAEMLAASGCSYVLVAHSERRQYFGETEETARKRILAAHRAGLKAILCVGETLEQRDRGEMEKVLVSQLEGGFLGLGEGDVAGLVLAYEPVWAIGTGRNATPQQAQDAHAFLRGWLKGRFGPRYAEATRIQYGGSVKPENARELLGQPDIDGALVGGASLKAASFLKIVQAASRP